MGYDTYNKYLCKTISSILETVYYMESRGKRVNLMENIEGAFESKIQQNINDLSFEAISQEFIMDFYFLFSFQSRFLYMNKCLNNSNNFMNSAPIKREIRRTHIVEDGLALFGELKGKGNQKT
jgi:hypothetical protein